MLRKAIVGAVISIACSAPAMAQLAGYPLGGRSQQPQVPPHIDNTRTGPFIYNQPGDPQLGGFFADGEQGQFYDQRIADDFTLALGAVVNGACWQGGSEFFFSPDILDNLTGFTYGFYADGGGVPGAAVTPLTVVPIGGVSVTNIGTGFFGETAYTFCIKFNPLVLLPGTYWFTMGGNLIDPFGDALVWYSSNPTFNNHIAAQLPVDAPWAGFDGLGDLGFQIQGVPEPATIGLLGLGIVMLRKRAKR